jgi:hypothetical protein
LLETETKVLVLGSLDLEFPIFPGSFANFNDELGFTSSLKPEVEIVSYRTPVDPRNPITGFELELGTKTVWRNFRDFGSATPKVRYRWSNSKFVHIRNSAAISPLRVLGVKKSPDQQT